MVNHNWKYTVFLVCKGYWMLLCTRHSDGAIELLRLHESGKVECYDSVQLEKHIRSYVPVSFESVRCTLRAIVRAYLGDVRFKCKCANCPADARRRRFAPANVVLGDY